MARTHREHTVSVLAVGLVFLTGYLALDSIELLFRPPAEYPPQSIPTRAITPSAFLAVIAWCLVGVFPVWDQLVRGRLPQAWSRYGRLLYTGALGLTLLHVAVAFHVGHGWSHAAAYRHVEEISGFGGGLFVNYFFVLLWVADVNWAWVNLDHYLQRPRWLSWAILVFMAFIVFNAAVVFGNGTRRIISSLLFLIPLYAIVATRPWRVRRETQEPGHGPGSRRDSLSAANHSPT